MDFHRQRKKQPSKIYVKINCKWILDAKIKGKTIKNGTRKHRKTLWPKVRSKQFRHDAQSKTSKRDWPSSKLKIKFIKDPVGRLKDKTQTGEKTHIKNTYPESL